MGIDNFHKWLKDNYIDCYITNKIETYDNIYIDGNHLLHYAMYGVNDEYNFLKKLKFMLDNILSNNYANKSIYIALDGASPFAKIILQRERRLKGIKNIDMKKFNSIYLTPGTETMKKIHEFLTTYIENFKRNFRYKKIEIELSDYDKPDEGELKVFKKLINNEQKYKNSTHLVIGNDADLIVFGMSIKSNNIYILSNIHNNKNYVSIELIKQKFINNINQYINKCSITDKNILNIQDDFVILSLFMGNDYLPKINYIQFDKLWEAYYNTKKIYSTEGIINYNNRTFNYNFLIKLFFNIINIISKQYQKIDIFKYNEKLIINYLEGILWCYNMYETANCSMYDYIYRYNISPKPIDILYYLILNPEININIPISNKQPLNSEVMTLLLIPKTARQLIPEKYQKYIDNELKDIYQQEECRECIEYSKELSKAHIELKNVKDINIDTTDVRKSISNISRNYSNHRKIHNNNKFNINTINKIIELIKI